MSSMTESEEYLGYFSRGIELRESGRLEEALEALSKASAGGPKLAHASHIMRGQVFWDTRDLKNVEREIRAALVIRPFSKKGSYFLFQVLVEQGRVEEALDEGRRFLGRIEDDPTDELLVDYRQHVMDISSFDPESFEVFREKARSKDWGPSTKPNSQVPGETRQNECGTE